MTSTSLNIPPISLFNLVNTNVHEYTKYLNSFREVKLISLTKTNLTVEREILNFVETLKR